jgi:type IV pilus assembly protein PilA
MRRLMKGLRRGEKGFTLIELLIVVAILGILAAIIVPNLASFLSTGNVAAANTEVANVESAALAYYADNNGTWPTDCTSAGVSLRDPPGTADPYLSADPVYNYLIGQASSGKVVVPADTAWPKDAKVVWNVAAHQWKKK